MARITCIRLLLCCQLTFHYSLRLPLFCIQGLVGLLHVPRAALDIVCSSRGVYCGRVALCEGPGCPWVDCSLVGGCGKAVPGNCRTIAGYQLATDARCVPLLCTATVHALQELMRLVVARYLVVVEKDAVYQRLVDNDFCALANCIMVTAKGMPDVATRAFVHHLLAAAPHLTAVACGPLVCITCMAGACSASAAVMPVRGRAVVDWNPSGAAILAAYKYGSQRMCEAARYTAPGLRWLGARGAQLHGMAQPALQVGGQHSCRSVSLCVGLYLPFVGQHGLPSCTGSLTHCLLMCRARCPSATGP